MATTNLGKVCVTPKGAWASGTAYEVLDIVTNAGGSYLAKQNVPAGTALSNTTYWLQIASKGDKGDTATVAVGSTTTGAEGTNASVTNSGTSTDGVFNFTIPRGNTGNGIQSITKTGSTGVVDHYRILFTDNDYFDYDVTNASSGVWGSITGTLEDQTDLQAELDNKADAITVTASGDIVSISDGGDNLPVKALSVAVEAVQDLHGYDAPWPAGAKPNIVYKMIANASIDASGLIVPDTGFNLFIAKVESGQTYTFSNDGVATNSSDTGYFSSDPVMGSVTYDGSRDLTVPATFTASYTGYIGLRLVASKTKGQLELGSTATTYAPYSNICPITGWTGANVTRCGKNVFDHSEVTILSSSLSDTNGTFSNLVTDTRTNLQLSIIAMNENTAVNTVSSFVVASTGVVSRTLTITHPCTSIRVKHNGLTRDIGIQYPWTLQGSVTISVNVQGYDPTTVGGLVLKDIQFPG